MAYQRGDVILAPFPFSNLRASKVRPAVVLSGSQYHASESDLILAAVTTKVSTATGPFDVVLVDWQRAGLRFPSALKPVLFTLDPSRVIYSIGTLTPTDLERIAERIKAALEL